MERKLQLSRESSPFANSSSATHGAQIRGSLAMQQLLSSSLRPSTFLFFFFWQTKMSTSESKNGLHACALVRVAVCNLMFLKHSISF